MAWLPISRQVPFQISHRKVSHAFDHPNQHFEEIPSASTPSPSKTKLKTIMEKIPELFQEESKKIFFCHSQRGNG